MIPVFLDTSGLIALVNKDDQWHEAAEWAWSELVAGGAPFLTTSLILIEIGDGLSKIRQRQGAIELYNRLRASRRTEILQIGEDEQERGWNLFRNRKDKEWGITDCISMAVMMQRGVNSAFSADHDFEQAGFQVLIERP